MRAVLGLAAIVAAIHPGTCAFAQETLPGANDVEVSYIYATFMGSGTYEINGRRLSMLSIPLSYTQRAMSPEQAGLTWSLPVVLGYDTVTEQDWFGDLLDEDLVTLTLLPGFRSEVPLDGNWVLKPFANLGMGHDFTSSENIWMGIAGLGVLGTWLHPQGRELRWGAALKAAGEYQQQTYHNAGFGLLESGIDIRWTTPVELAKRAVDTGAYYIVQYFVPEWEIDNLRPRKSDIGLLHEIGISIGLKRPITFLGMHFARLRMGYSWGSGVTGWSFGTDFPF